MATSHFDWTGRFFGSARRARPAPRRALSIESLETRAVMTVNGADGTPAVFESTAIGQAAYEGAIARIVNGTVTTAYPTVGMVGDTSGFHCSGTLIGSQYVLTAGHCAEGVAATAGRFKLGNVVYNTSQVFLHPNYNGNLIGSDGANDIAIFKLDRPVLGIAPSAIYRAAPSVGQSLTLVGFGGAGNGTTGHDGSFGTKRVGTTPIDGVTSKLITWRFDNNSESNTAPGDSGGPAFVNVGGTLYVAGVTSGGDRDDAAIGDRSFDTRVDAYASWIDSIVGAASSSAQVSVVAGDATAAETRAGQTANPGSFTISRTGPLASALTVNLAMSGTAANGTDYNAVPATVIIPAGAASTTVALTVRDDTLVEGAETAILSIGAGGGYAIAAANAKATISIADNDTATSNDRFADRRSLQGALVQTTGSNVGATRETGEPNVLGISGGKSVWWTWTAPVSGTVSISTAGSGFDTTLGVYRGTAVNALTLVGASDDENYGAGVTTSRVSFTATAGQSYQIVVDGYRGATGAVRLSIDQPSGRKSAPRTGDVAAQVFAATDFRGTRSGFDWRVGRSDSQRVRSVRDASFACDSDV